LEEESNSFIETGVNCADSTPEAVEDTLYNYTIFYIGIITSGLFSF